MKEAIKPKITKENKRLSTTTIEWKKSDYYRITMPLTRKSLSAENPYSYHDWLKLLNLEKGKYRREGVRKYFAL